MAEPGNMVVVPPDPLGNGRLYVDIPLRFPGKVSASKNSVVHAQLQKEIVFHDTNGRLHKMMVYITAITSNKPPRKQRRGIRTYVAPGAHDYKRRS